MISLTISGFLTYCFIAWGTNMLLNVLGIIKRKYPRMIRFDKPIDAGLSYKGDRLIGESTTVAGLILCFALYSSIFTITQSGIWSAIPLLVYGGHTLGSIIKRRMHKKGGEFVPFIDHGDYMLSTGGVFIFLQVISPIFFIYSLLLTYALHPLVCYISFKTKLREHPW